MAGDPRHAKAKGYTGPATDPVAKLSENFGKMNAEVGQLFSALSHLKTSFKAFERLISRVNFMMMVSGGFRSAVPYGLRDMIGKGGHAGARGSGGHGQSSFGGGGAGSPGRRFYPNWRDGGGRSPALDPAMARTYGPRGWGYGSRGAAVNSFLGGPTVGGNTDRASSIFGPTGKYAGMSSGKPGRTATQVTNANFTVKGRANLLIGGGSPPPGAFDAFYRGGRPNPDGTGAAGSGVTRQGVGQFFLASTAMAGGAIKAGAPDALETFMKSLELAAAKMGGSFVPPLAAASKHLQGFANWFERQPEILKEGFGWVAAFGIAGSAAVLMIGTLSKAAMSAAAACAWLARSAGGAAIAGPGGAAGGLAAGGGGLAGVGSGGAMAGSSRLGGLLSKAGKVLGPAGAVIAGMDVAGSGSFAEAAGKTAEYNPIAGGGLIDTWLRKKAGIMGPGEALEGAMSRWTPKSKGWIDRRWNEIKGGSALGLAEQVTGTKLNPFDKGTGGKPNNKVQLSSVVDPQFMGIEDVYRQVQLSVLKQPLEQEIMTEQLKNLGGFMEEMVGQQKTTNTKLDEIARKDEFKK